MDGSEHATEEEAKSHISHNSLHSSLSPSVVTSAGRSFDGLDSANEPQTGEVESSLLMNIDTSYETEIVLDVDVDTDSKVTDESSRYWAVDDVVTNMTFTCPKCGRSFLGDWMGCHKHMTTRRHGQRCKYGAENNSNGMPANTGSLPSCLSEHSMLPLDQHSGWCELQGRRRYMEDMHSVVFEESYKLFGVFDGHSGAKAARFASKRLHTLFDLYLSMDDTSAYPADPSEDELNWQQQAERLGRINVGFRDPVTKLFALSSHSCQNTTQSSIARGSELLVFADNKKDYPEPEDGPDDDVTSRAPGITVAHGIRAMKEAFRHTNSDLASTMSAGDLSGSTASLAVQFQDHLLIANVGDSRVVLCCSSAAQPHSQAQSHQNTTNSPVEHGMNQGVSAVSHPVQLTVDHTPYDPVERLAVESKGGFVSEDGVYRVNGKLAVSRSLGDYSYASVLSSEPDVFVLRLRPQPAQSATQSLSHLDRSVSAQTPPLSDLNAGERGSSSSRKGNAAAPSAPIGGTWPLDSVASVNACSAYRQAALSHTSMAIAADGSAHLQPLFLILASGTYGLPYSLISKNS